MKTAQCIKHINICKTHPMKCVKKIKILLASFEKSTVKEEKEELTLKLAPLTSMRNISIRLHDELVQLHVSIQQALGKPELYFIACKQCEETIQQSEPYLNHNFTNQVFTVKKKFEYNMQLPNDSHACRIKAICALQDGQVLIADFSNNKVKLLNQKYQLVSHWNANACPHSICQITSSEVAVAVYGCRNTHEALFIEVCQNQLMPDRKFQVQHTCIDIAHQQGDLYISSGTALNRYSLSGKLANKVYENTENEYTVYSCAVSPTGDKRNITSYFQHTLLNLARDGILLATFTDPELLHPRGIHVTPAGQALVCGTYSSTILQVKSKGHRKLATLVTEKRDGVREPWSVCYSSTTSSIIVGKRWDSILVLRVEKKLKYGRPARTDVTSAPKEESSRKNKKDRRRKLYQLQSQTTSLTGSFQSDV
ncbi:hypothetical protein DPMN_043958 [Dreissena polymorpha]|uniref:Uncharacterized protein n=1 Tax=Dreissena polymorpha TaxID=45954 RepID=A0A9D4D3N1_DREPO|nr:hypothetical protein DPMN_043958 [Dreissena polymorpha]